MEKMKCPYCECQVRMSDVETDDGACPECGAPLMGSLIFDEADSDGDPFDEAGDLDLDDDADDDDDDDDSLQLHE